jgi:hypothetical protein
MKRQLRLRLKTGLVIISMLVLVMGPVLANLINSMIDDRVQKDWTIQSPEISSLQTAPCEPEIPSTVFESLDQLTVMPEDDLKVSLRMAQLMFSDQAVRGVPWTVNPQRIDEEDRLRRIEVLDFIKNGEIRSGRNLVYGAFIFHHGDCSEHYLFAHQLAETAVDAGYSDARWIYAATLDRYLMSLGALQKYGTQYTWIDGEFKLYPTDPNVSDLERAEFQVPPLTESVAQTAEPGDSDVMIMHKQRLDTWWLTLIGTSFAALSVVIGILDEKPNALLGWISLFLAITTLLISILGHYFQVIALNQGMGADEMNFWQVVNYFLLFIWLVCALIEGFRKLRSHSLKTLNTPDDINKRDVDSE